MDKSTEQLNRNIQKLDEMIKEMEKRIKVLQESRTLMKKYIAALKFHDKMVNIRKRLDMDKIISDVRSKVGKK